MNNLNNEDIENADPYIGKFFILPKTVWSFVSTSRRDEGTVFFVLAKSDVPKAYEALFFDNGRTDPIGVFWVKRSSCLDEK